MHKPVANHQPGRGIRPSATSHRPSTRCWVTSPETACPRCQGNPKFGEWMHALCMYRRSWAASPRAASPVPTRPHRNPRLPRSRVRQP